MWEPTLNEEEAAWPRPTTRVAQDWQLALAWGAATVGGLVFGALTGLMLVWIITFDLNPRTPSAPWVLCFALAGFIAGLILGVAQMGTTELLPRLRRIAHPGRWILATGLALALGAALMELLSFSPLRATGRDVLVGAEMEAAFFMAGGAVMGLLLGLVQWLVLRAQVSRAGWWIVAMTVSGALFLPGLLTTLGTLGELPFATGVDALLTPVWMIFLIPAALLFPAIITGATFVWLVRRPVAGT